jgi:hypothetical protein
LEPAIRGTPVVESHTTLGFFAPVSRTDFGNHT